MKLIYMEPTLRLIAVSSPEILQNIESKGMIKQAKDIRYIIIEDGKEG
jgi:hypothetical protein